MVDDVSDDRELVRSQLEAIYPAVEVVEVSTRAELDQALQGPQLDLVVTDLALGWGSGREVFERIQIERPGCPVVMFTGSGDETTAVELLKAGLDDYVVKSPKQLPRLRASLKVVIEASRNRAALSERESQLTAALVQRDVLVRELHHRVKNNLQTIMSLLQLRAKTVGGLSADHLNELSGRMLAMSRVQARVYETEQFDRVDFCAVLSDIAHSLCAAYREKQTTLDLDCQGPLDLDADRAMPMALLCYEVILNSLKHAWPGNQKGRLHIALRIIKPGSAEIRIADNGIGFVEDQVKHGLGSRLVRALTGEAQARISTVSGLGEGTTVTLQLL